MESNKDGTGKEKTRLPLDEATVWDNYYDSLISDYVRHYIFVYSSFWHQYHLKSNMLGQVRLLTYNLPGSLTRPLSLYGSLFKLVINCLPFYSNY